LNFKEILELIDKVAESGIGSVEVEQAGTKVRIEGKNAPVTVHTVAASDSASSPMIAAPQQMFAAPAPAPQESKSVDAAANDPNVHIITSPIVGTFYRSANPEAPPFVNVGDRVTKGKVLCIIEAMKLMNEIESDFDGTVVTIYPQNGQPIEYGEKLFAIKA
jgi:acetyl-CoA carboxylase biotin carboxyl carrier protein